MQTENTGNDLQNQLPTRLDLIEKELGIIRNEISVMKKLLLEKFPTSQVSPCWIPRKAVMEFFSYGNTQMAELVKSGQIVVTQVGKRQFVHKESISKLLVKNIVNRDSGGHEC